MRQDTFYAFSELFEFAASSENQFVNFMEEQVKTASRAFRGQETWFLETLKYSKALLDEHITSIRATISCLEDQENLQIPRANRMELRKAPQYARLLLQTSSTCCRVRSLSLLRRGRVWTSF